jgi:hypothetical protein
LVIVPYSPYVAKYERSAKRVSAWKVRKRHGFVKFPVLDHLLELIKAADTSPYTQK